MMVAISSKMNG